MSLLKTKKMRKFHWKEILCKHTEEHIFLQFKTLHYQMHHDWKKTKSLELVDIFFVFKAGGLLLVLQLIIHYLLFNRGWIGGSFIINNESKKR